LSKGKLAGALVCFFVIATTAGTWAARNSYAVPSIPILLSAASFDRPNIQELQTSNTDAKSDRLAVVMAAVGNDDATPQAAAPASYSLASLNTTAVEPPKPRLESRVIDPRKPVAAAPEKPKRAEPQKLLLDDAQIASLRTRLKLSPTQEEFWPAVEVTLRNVIRQHARNSRKSPSGVVPQIDVNSAEVQQLISAAVPLIMRLSEEQKREVRALARIIGLETVASRI
jgi:hypothetical protein